MVYTTVPRDLTKVKNRVLFGLTRRWLACFPPAVLMGVSLFSLLKGGTGTDAASFCMIFIMFPFFLLGMYERSGEPLEIIAKHFIRTEFLLSKGRPYQANNLYAVLI